MLQLHYSLLLTNVCYSETETVSVEHIPMNNSITYSYCLHYLLTMSSIPSHIHFFTQTMRLKMYTIQHISTVCTSAAHTGTATEQKPQPNVQLVNYWSYISKGKVFQDFPTTTCQHADYMHQGCDVL